MRFDVLTLFPELFAPHLSCGITRRAFESGQVDVRLWPLRDFAEGNYRRVDDRPFGGGPGMVMRADVVDRAIGAALDKGPALPLVYLTPRGRPLDQARVKDLAAGPGVLLLCGRFEGVDERVLEARGAEEISLGDFVLSGGEPAALVLLDACIRLLPGVIGKDASLEEESFERGLLEYPHYTRPQLWEGRAVPEVLLSGHHERIRSWRLARSEEMTKARRPDLWDRYAAARNKVGRPEAGRGRVKEEAS